MRSRGGAALLLALLASACAGFSGIPRSRLDAWHATETGGVRLVGDVTPEELRELAGSLARFDAIFAMLVGWRPGAGTPLCVYLLRDRGVAERFGLARGVAGFAFSTLDESFIAVYVTSGRDEDRNTLFHEYTHFLMGRNRRAPLPRWYGEGLATYFGTVSERGGAVVVGAAPALQAAWVSGRGVLPLERLFADSLADMRAEEVGDYYATAWALSHYLLATPSGRRELSAFVRQLEQGVPSEEAQRSAFGRPLDRLAQEVAAHVVHLARGVPLETVIDSSEIEAPVPPPAAALTPGEAAHALGRLALALAQVDEGSEWPRGPALAQSLFAFALAESPSDARAEAALGEARALRGDGAGALAAVELALARAPDDPRVRLHAARVALLRAAEEEQASSHIRLSALLEAERQYRYALGLVPESAAAWFGLGQALRELGRADEAFAAFESARRFGWSEALDLALARLHLERGEREQATALLLPIAQNPHAGRAQEDAAALLSEAQPRGSPASPR
jgi:Flp pilus assembly protein TadD